VHPSLFPLLNIDTGREWRRPRNTLEPSLSPHPRHVAFAFAFHPSTSYLYVPYVLAFILKVAGCLLGVQAGDGLAWFFTHWVTPFVPGNAPPLRSHQGYNGAGLCFNCRL
jgi:hypothetical protein